MSQPGLLNAVSATTPSAIVNNIGQGQHLAVLFLSGGSCIAQNTDIRFERSSNPTSGSPIWTTLGTPNTRIDVDVSGDLTATMVAYGAAEGVRVNPATFDTANCALTVDYIGALVPGVFDTRLDSESYSRVAVDLTASGNSTLVAATAGLRVCVYDMGIIATAALLTTSLRDGAATILAGPYGPFSTFSFFLSTGMNSGGTSIPLCTSTGNALVWNQSAVTTTTGGWVVFRYQE